MRAFLSVDLPGLTIPAARRPEAPEHLTLLFLGEVAEDEVPPLVEAFGAAVRPFAAFDLTLEGVGAFPTRERPRIVWVGVGEGAIELTQIAEALRAAARGRGRSVEDRPFVPHLTLMRVRGRAEAARARELLAHPPSVEGRSRVDAVAFKQSELTPDGAVHRVVAHLPLGGSATPVSPASPFPPDSSATRRLDR